LWAIAQLLEGDSFAQYEGEWIEAMRVAREISSRHGETALNASTAWRASPLNHVQ
jgi:hypothetical protein